MSSFNQEPASSDSLSLTSSSSKKSSSPKKTQTKKPVDLDDYKAVRKAYFKHNDLGTAVSWMRSLNLVADSKDDKDDTFMEDLINKKAKTLEKPPPSETTRREGSGTRTVTVSATTYATINPVIKYGRGKPMGLTPSMMYVATDVLFREHQRHSLYPGRVLSLDEFFSVKGVNGDDADIVIISGEGGTGKSLFLKYVLEKWSDKDNPIEGLESRNLIFFTDFPDHKFGTFTELAGNLLKNTMDQMLLPEEHVKPLVLSLPILVAVDGFDQSPGVSSQLLREVLQMDGSDLKIIITCRPQYVDTLFSYIPRRKKKCTTHLAMNCIPSAYRPEFVRRFIDTRMPVKESNRKAKELIIEGLISRLPEIEKAVGDDMSNPLMLTIITGMWFEHPVVEIGSREEEIVVRN